MTPNNVKLECHFQNETLRVLLNQTLHVLPQMQKYLGKKIFTANDGRAKIFNLEYAPWKAIPAGKGKVTEQGSGFILERSGSRIELKLTLCFTEHQGNEQLYCRYFKRSATLGRLDENTHQILESVSNESSLDDLRLVVNADEEYKKILKYKALLEQAQSIPKLIDSAFYTKHHMF